MPGLRKNGISRVKHASRPMDTELLGPQYLTSMISILQYFNQLALLRLRRGVCWVAGNIVQLISHGKRHPVVLSRVFQ